MKAKIAVIYYSSTGNVYKLAKAIAQGAEEQGAEVRLRRVPELAPDEAIQKNTAWWEHHLMEEQSVAVATLDDLDWANGIAMGTPTRFGNMASQLKQFIDTTGGLWAQGKLANKAVTSFTATMNRHGGQESTILSMNNVFYHWGCVIVPPGYTDPQIFKSGGNPYGTSIYDNLPSDQGESVLESAKYQGKRLAKFAKALLTIE
jgi:NAD(P)H dehydrogenase (quinone)